MTRSQMHALLWLVIVVDSAAIIAIVVRGITNRSLISAICLLVPLSIAAYQLTRPRST